MATTAATMKIADIAARIAHPWRRSRTISPNVRHSAPGIRKIATISMKFESGVGFSNGWAEFVLKKPPPLVPRCLMATWDAAGPTASVCSVTVTFSVTGLPWASLTGAPEGSSFGWSTTTGWTSATFLYGASVCTTPCDTRASATISDRGSRMYSVPRTVSTQKLPIVEVVRRAIPRIRATSTAIPDAAERKFCTVRPSICVR